MRFHGAFFMQDPTEVENANGEQAVFSSAYFGWRYGIGLKGPKGNIFEYHTIKMLIKIIHLFIRLLSLHYLLWIMHFTSIEMSKRQSQIFLDVILSSLVRQLQYFT